MTTLTLRVNLYDKTLEPALAGEPEAIAVGETVKLRLLGLGFSATDVQAINAAVASDAVTPALRARMRHDGMGDIAIYPFPGDTPAWTVETVDGETAVCCDIDLGTAQAYGLFGGAPLPDGANRKIRLLVERSFPNESPTLYASDILRVGSWSFPGHELRFLGHPKGTDLTEQDIQDAVSGAASGFKDYVDDAVSGAKATMIEQAGAIAAALSGVTEETISGLKEALDAVTAEEMSGVVASGLSGCVTISGEQTVTGNKTFVDKITINSQSGVESESSGADLVVDTNGNLILSHGSDMTCGNESVYIGEVDGSGENLAVTKKMLNCGIDNAFDDLGFTFSGGHLYPQSGTNAWALMSLGMSVQRGHDIGEAVYLVDSALSGLDISGYAPSCGLIETVVGLSVVVSGLMDKQGSGGSFCEMVDNCIGNTLCGMAESISGLNASLTTLSTAVGYTSGLDNSIVSRIETLEAAVEAMSGSGSGSGGGGGGGGDESGSGGGDDPVDPPFPPPLTPPIG